MAIKIKKKDGKDEAEAEAEVEAAAAGAVELSEEADPFLRASWETASWIEDNRMLVLGGIATVLIAILAGYGGLSYLEQGKVEASAALTPAFQDYNTLIEGSKEYDSLKANPDIKLPEKTFKSDDERWQAIYDDASGALAKHPSSEVALAATLTKASAAAKLGKHDEAIELYKEYIATSPDSSMKTAAQHGLATAYASAEKWDDALAALDELAKTSEEYEASLRYQRARILQRAGKSDEAKTLYHEILDKDPAHPSKADIERRLANM